MTGIGKLVFRFFLFNRLKFFIMNRRELIKLCLATPFLGAISGSGFGMSEGALSYQSDDFAEKLSPVGRILEMEGWYVWGTSPIFGPDGMVHVFFSRWLAVKKMGGWINSSEIAHAIAGQPEGPYHFHSTVLAPRGPGYWDATTCHNPHIKFVDGLYCLFYMGNSNGKTDTKRVGLAVSDSLFGPWERLDHPLLEPSGEESWDNHCTTNPSFIKHPNGQYWLYYKSWNSNEYYNSNHPAIKGNRKYGLAIADNLRGPYVKYKGNPVVDFSNREGNAQLEDAFIYLEDGRFKMLARDMGFFDHESGLILESDDGLSWSEPRVAYHGMACYREEPPAPAHLKRYGRLERPQLLFREGKPVFLFTAAQGGEFMTSSAFVLKIKE